MNKSPTKYGNMTNDQVGTKHRVEQTVPPVVLFKSFETNFNYIFEDCTLTNIVSIVINVRKTNGLVI